MAEKFYIESGTGRQVSDLTSVDPTKFYIESGTGASISGATLKPTVTGPVNTFGEPISTSGGSMVPQGSGEPSPIYTPPAYTPPPPPSPIAVDTVTQPQTPIPVNLTSPSHSYDVANLPDPTFGLTAPEGEASALSKELQNLNDSTVGKSAYKVEQERLAGVPGFQATINDLGSQLTALKNEAAAIPLQLQQGAADRGVTTPVLGKQENSRLRTNAIAALGVSTLLAAAQGQLASAQAFADKAVEAKYGPIEEEIAAKMANLDLIIHSPEYTNADKERAFNQQKALQKQTDAIAQQKSDYSDVLKISSAAAGNIANFVATAQFPTAGQALKAMSEATDPRIALQIAASVGLTTSATTAGDQLLSPTEAKTLGVPYGTTRAQAVAQGITPSAPVSNGKPYTSGSLTLSPSEQDEILSILGSGKTNTGAVYGNARGSDGFVDPAVYLKLLDNWVSNGGQRGDFVTRYPAKDYINPANTWIGAELNKRGVAWNPAGGSSGSGGTGGSSADALFNSL